MLPFGRGLNPSGGPPSSSSPPSTISIPPRGCEGGWCSSVGAMDTRAALGARATLGTQAASLGRGITSLSPAC